MLLVFAHLLAASMALGAIVATDLRLLSKLSQDRVRIAPPNEFVARIVMVALLMLYVTGGAIVWHGALERPDYLTNPKLQAKVIMVVLLTLNAFVLHRITFPRLARGRRVARWHASDWAVVAVPVAISNFLWMFSAFLGIARPWNYTMPLRDILEIAAGLYVVAQIGVFTILAIAGRAVEPDRKHVTDVLRRSLASLGSLGRPIVPVPAEVPSSRRRARSMARRLAEAGDSTALMTEAGEAKPAVVEAGLTTAGGRPALRLVGTRPGSVEPMRRRTR